MEVVKVVRGGHGEVIGLGRSSWGTSMVTRRCLKFCAYLDGRENWKFLFLPEYRYYSPPWTTLGFALCTRVRDI